MTLSKDKAMTDMDAVVRLAERCEAATGPDRGLDALIAPFQELTVVDQGYPLGRCCYAADGQGVELPRYTASVDAATSVFPTGTMYRSGHEGDGLDPSRFCCQAVTDAPDCHVIRAVADTEPLARLAAALRARARSQGDTSDG